MKEQDLGLLMICSLRYSIGRKSGILSNVTRIIIKYAHRLDRYRLEMLLEEVKDAYTTVEIHSLSEHWVGLVREHRDRLLELERHLTDLIVKGGK